MFTLPQIYPITDTGLTNLTHAEQCARLVKGGSRFLQIREKRMLSNAFFEAAEAALTIARRNDAKLIINDRVDIARVLGAAGVHLGQDDLPPEKAREILGETAIIGFSTHSVAQALEAVRRPVDYIAIGPVFATSTKENPDAVVGLAGVRKVREAIGAFPLVAIGGIDLENYREVLKAGADSVAVIKGLLAEPDRIAENFRKFGLE